MVRFCRLWLFLILAAALFAAGCSLRNAPSAGTESGRHTEVPSPSPSPTEPPLFTVEYRMDDELLASETVYAGQLPGKIPEMTDRRLLGWTGTDGQTADPSMTPVTADVVYRAVTRPLIRAGVPFLFPDENGRIRPGDPFTLGDAASMVRAVVSDTAALEDTLALWDAAPEEIIAPSALLSAAEAVFSPEEAFEAFGPLSSSGAEQVTRRQAADAVIRLTGDEAADIDKYFPDADPAREDNIAVLAVSAAGSLRPEELLSRAKDGFFWIDGYLYSLDDRGFFHTGETLDGLSYDDQGRYTCGSAELDAFVAETLIQFTKPENTRLEDLKAVYLHIKNDFKYLPRNYYASGADGWDIQEALTFFQTGKGNCYCYTGAFCALARGLGYNARTWSGTMGNQNQPHAWTEIDLNGEIYICDPEIELNYWLLQMYTDNFMMPKAKSGGWNYQAVGRPGI